MEAEKLINWRTADERRLKVERVLDYRAEQHREGGFFLIDQLVQYENGMQGWRRLMRLSDEGRPYSEKCHTRKHADDEIASLKNGSSIWMQDIQADFALLEAARRLGFRGEEAKFDALKRLWDHTPRGARKAPNADDCQQAPNFDPFRLPTVTPSIEQNLQLFRLVTA